MIKGRLLPQNYQSRAVWSLCLTSFMWSCSSLMVIAVLPTFLHEELGAGFQDIGFWSGIAVFLAFCGKVLSGVLSDYLRKRTGFIFAGTFLGFFVKPILIYSQTAWHIWLVRSVDRIGKGLRAAPTDALLADLSTKNDGAIFGLRQAFYTSGAVCGALLSMAVLGFYPGHYRLLFSLSLLPSLAAIGLLFWGFSKTSPQDNLKSPKCVKYFYKDMPTGYWSMIAMSAFLGLAHFDEAFMTLRARELGWPISTLPIIIVLSDTMHAIMAFFCGPYADKGMEKKIFWTGLGVFVIAHLTFAWAQAGYMLIFGVLAQGIHMGMTHGILRSMIARSTPPHLRGSAFAGFYLTSALSLLGANTLAGFLAENFGLSSVFFSGAIISFLVFTIATLKQIQNLIHHLKPLSYPWW